MKILLTLFFILLSFPLAAAFNLSVSAYIAPVLFQEKTGNIDYVIESNGDELVYNLTLFLKTFSHISSNSTKREINILYPNEKKTISFPINIIEDNEGSYGIIVFGEFLDRFGIKYALLSPGLVSYKTFKSLEDKVAVKLDKINISIGEIKSIPISIKNLNNDSKKLSIEFFVTENFEILDEKNRLIPLGPLEEKVFSFNLKAKEGLPNSTYSLGLIISNENKFNEALVKYNQILIEGVKISSEPQMSYWILSVPLIVLIFIFFYLRRR
jgi:hypothetical protein